jgi:hypothetical protein
MTKATTRLVGAASEPLMEGMEHLDTNGLKDTGIAVSFSVQQRAHKTHARTPSPLSATSQASVTSLYCQSQSAPSSSTSG